MDKLRCKLCNNPRMERNDRPGKFYSMCRIHRLEYMREKNRESYWRNPEKHRTHRKDRYWADPEKARKEAIKSQSTPEAKTRRRKYMETYLRPWRAHLKDSCERCGYTSEHRCMLDIHHKDHDKSNNHPENLMTVCPTCHREIHVEEGIRDQTYGT